MKKILLLLFTVFLFYGCGLFKDLGSNFGEGVVEPLSVESDTIGYNLIQGMKRSLTDPEFQKELDSLITALGNSTNAQLKGIIDSLLSEDTKNKIGLMRDELIGDKTSAKLVQLRNAILDKHLQNYLTETVSGLGTNLLNDSTLTRLGAVRDTILGQRSNELIRSIVDSMMVTLAGRINTDINPLLKQNLSFIEKNATWLLILIGAIALGITAFIWHQRQKYLKMTKLLTFQISDLDQATREKIKDKVSQNAKTIGIEAELRNFLDAEGLLHLDK
ncbi:MAG: hypothetical protein IPM56_12760 [Ignavibacteriales bacterium]|nr:MAG: hypothetical protein IPM56_12760 [Ignavibacteriales bacterium]